MSLFSAITDHADALNPWNKFYRDMAKDNVKKIKNSQQELAKKFISNHIEEVSNAFDNNKFTKEIVKEMFKKGNYDKYISNSILNKILSNISETADGEADLDGFQKYIDEMVKKYLSSKEYIEDNIKLIKTPDSKDDDYIDAMTKECSTIGDESLKNIVLKVIEHISGEKIDIDSKPQEDKKSEEIKNGTESKSEEVKKPKSVVEEIIESGAVKINPTIEYTHIDPITGKAIANPDAPFNNMPIINKYNKNKDLINLMNTARMRKYEIEYTQGPNDTINVKSYFKPNNSKEKHFIIDLNGSYYNKEPKAVLPFGTEQYLISLDRINDVFMYIEDNIDINDLIQDDMIRIDKLKVDVEVQIDSLPKANMAELLKIFVSKEFEDKFKEAKSKDSNARFKMNEFTDINNFELISDNSVPDVTGKTYIDKPTQYIVMEKGKLELEDDNEEAATSNKPKSSRRKSNKR